MIGRGLRRKGRRGRWIRRKLFPDLCCREERVGREDCEEYWPLNGTCVPIGGGWVDRVGGSGRGISIFNWLGHDFRDCSSQIGRNLEALWP